MRYARFAGAVAAAAFALTVSGCQDDSTAPEQAQPAATSSKTTRYIVLMKETQARTGLRTMSAEVGLLGGRVERLHQEAGLAQVQLTPSGATALRKRPDIEAVVPDRTVQWLPPNEMRMAAPHKVTAQSNQRSAQFFDQFQWNLKKIQAPKAWGVSRQGAGVTVCVLDSGIDARQIDLVGKLDLDLSASFVGNERADRDFAAHGTTTASCWWPPPATTPPT